MSWTVYPLGTLQGDGGELFSSQGFCLEWVMEEGWGSIWTLKAAEGITARKNSLIKGLGGGWHLTWMLRHEARYYLSSGAPFLLPHPSPGSPPRRMTFFVPRILVLSLCPDS